MGDKVYGFCGTNKCKREVIAKTDINMVEVTASVTIDNYHPYVAATIPYPKGFTSDNTRVLSIMVHDAALGDTTWVTGDVSRYMTANVQCIKDEIHLMYGPSISNGMFMTSGTYKFKVLLLQRN